MELVLLGKSHRVSQIFPLCEDTVNQVTDSQTPNLLLTVSNKFLLFAIFYSEKAMVTHSSTLAWKIPWMEEPRRL